MLKCHVPPPSWPNVALGSTWEVFSAEIDFLKDMFLKNGYPEQLFTSCLRRFLNSKFAKPNVTKCKEDGVETFLSHT